MLIIREHIREYFFFSLYANNTDNSFEGALMTYKEDCFLTVICKQWLNSEIQPRKSI